MARSSGATVGRGRLLEVGAGAGELVRVAPGRGWEVHATEGSESAVQALRTTAAHVFFGEVERAAYPVGFFDLVVSIEALDHVPTPAPHPGELRRVCRAGGLLLLTTPNFKGASARAFGVGWRVVDREHLAYFTWRTLRRALRRAGSARVSVRSRSIDVTAWRHREEIGRPPSFNPALAAGLGQRVEASCWLRLARSHFAWARNGSMPGPSCPAWREPSGGQRPASLPGCCLTVNLTSDTALRALLRRSSPTAAKSKRKTIAWARCRYSVPTFPEPRA
jgi:SAM-dependent methyltransferase